MRHCGFRRDERGAAAVEFAIVLPLLLVIVFGIIDFGRYLAVRNNLAAAVREGARLASAQATSAEVVSVGRGRTAGYLAAVERGADSAATAGLVSVTMDQPAAGLITVSVTGYAFSPVTPYADQFFKSGSASSIALPAFSAVFRWERSL